MDRHDRLCGAVEGICGEGRVHEHRDQSRLPVVAMDNVGTEADNRQDRQNSLTEECKALDVPFQVRGIWVVTLIVELVVNKIEFDAVVLILHDANVNAVGSIAVVHIEVSNILEIVPEFSGDTGVIGQDHTDVELVLIDILRQSAHNVSQTACLYKGNTFRSSEEDIFHAVSSLHF